MCVAQISYEVGDERERILVVHHEGINLLVVLYWSQLSVLFPNKEEG